ncbi:MAG: metalloendopeptidase-like membrane protein [Candidatus Peregrinibacteria bacterium Greene0416_62]|nr:MAG: metalloendopeptidase-like membrane protein [Candidatus Peregrinibacteria bacterium Greene0416_62]
MHTVNRRRHGFTIRSMHTVAEPHVFHYLSQRASFWIAALSVIAYIAGNMMGQYGWHTFWASVLGKTDDSLIVYTGTVTPIAQVPDYSRWGQYGGNPKEHTFTQVPIALLVPLPKYSAGSADADNPSSVYSMGHLGSYATGAENSGSHVGVDIRVPTGTPIRAVMNGVVERVDTTGNGGLGIMVMLRHPNVPDPSDPRKTTTLYSIYGHLNGALATAGSLVSKGEQIGYSGKTGFATGPHLHFQMDRAEALWHPFWPFTGEEQRTAGLSFVAAVDQGLNQAEGKKYTINPMLYVQANYPAARTTIASADPGNLPAPRVSRLSRIASRKESRIALRGRQVVAVQPASSSVSLQTAVLSRSTVVTASPEQLPPSGFHPAAAPPTGTTIEITHDGDFTGRGWEEVRIRILDGNGEVVRNPELSSDIYLRTAFGEAEFRPAQLSAFDFERGAMTVQVLPRGRRTVIIEAKPYGVTSRPMVYGEN